jgi:Fe-S oxidoreductase
MVEVLQSPARTMYGVIPGSVLYLSLHIIGILCFAYIVAKRLIPLIRAQPDFRMDRPLERLGLVLKYWFGQWRHPRYRTAGLIHILVFAGFLILVTRAVFLLVVGISGPFVMPGFSGTFGHVYDVTKDYAATIVFLCMVVAAVRRLVFKPKRYSVPAKFGKGRQGDAILLLALIAILMAADALFESSEAAAQIQRGLEGEIAAVLSLPWIFKHLFAANSPSTLWYIHHGSLLLHEVTFFGLLCYRPFGIQFHVETSLFSIYFAKLDRGTVKPVRWGIPDEQLDQLKSFGVKTFSDFTWKHVLDFYSCADCGRCSDQCPANAAGRPLSPRFLTIKARNYCFEHYPVIGSSGNGSPLVGKIYSGDEIWSCTTCGACEAECPLFVEYIDKIVDLRRGLVDEGNVPQSLQKPLKAMESRGNPYGKLDKKRGEWTAGCDVKVLSASRRAETLYFVDSITSYDGRIQSIGRATARILKHVGQDFGILGAAERDSGHEVRRFGEETLFLALRDRNVDAIRTSGARRIVTSDPHAYNSLKHDYKDIPPVEHISQVVAREVRAGKVHFNAVENPERVFAYHDPCYLGRHNSIFDAPREVLDAIPGLKRVEMRKCRDRSFCCGGGGLALFYEPEEEQRMGVLRVRMAAEAGADVIVTACPFCMVNLEDAIKVEGLEGKMTAIDVVELVDQQMVREGPHSTNQGG